MHFIANIEVTKVTEQVIPRSSSVPERTERKKAPIARIVVAAETVESLIAKASAHLDLVEDSGDISEGRVHRGE